MLKNEIIKKLGFCPPDNEWTKDKIASYLRKEDKAIVDDLIAFCVDNGIFEVVNNVYVNRGFNEKESDLKISRLAIPLYKADMTAKEFYNINFVYALYDLLYGNVERVRAKESNVKVLETLLFHKGNGYWSKEDIGGTLKITNVKNLKELMAFLVEKDIFKVVYRNKYRATENFEKNIIEYGFHAIFIYGGDLTIDGYCKQAKAVMRKIERAKK